MSGLLLTQNSTFLFQYVVKALGLLMNVIFSFLSVIGIPNIGLAIILFTIIIYLLLTPLTIKSQKYSKLSAKMNPEMQAIQAKYKGKQDQTSMIKMNDEMKALYAKYGASPSGTCLPLLIQMPILFALYRVIEKIPAYVGQVREAFYPLVTNIMTTEGAPEFIHGLKSAAIYSKESPTLENTIIDVLNRCSTAEWASIAENFPNLGDMVTSTQSALEQFNSFLGLNIANSPGFSVQQGFSSGNYLLIIGALAIPALAGLTQWLNTKMMPQPEVANTEENPMASSLKTMNVMMPIMSMIFCYTLPAGMGLYWIMGAVVRSIQQVLINKHIDKMDLDAMIKENIEKYNKKREKQGLPQQKFTDPARMNSKNIPQPKKKSMTEEERQAAMKASTEYYNQNTAKPGSLAAKAQMVKQYNEQHKK